MESARHFLRAPLLDGCERDAPLVWERSRPHLILASNRGPVEFSIEGDRLLSKRGSGGVVTALLSLKDYALITWLASPMTSADRMLADMLRDVPISPIGPEVRIALSAAPESAYDLFYNVVSNPVLWYCQHQMGEELEGRYAAQWSKAWSEGYVPINRAMANSLAIACNASQDVPVVFVQDYHFYLVPRMLRERVPNAVILDFVHIPWPSPRHWAFLPHGTVESILDGLTACDIVGVQTQRSVYNFLTCCNCALSGAHVDFTRQCVHFRGHSTMVRAYPISINPQATRAAAASDRCLKHGQELAKLARERTVVRVDRMDPSKNLKRGFEAWRILLERHPEWHERTTMLAFLVPCRENVPEYRDYANAVLRQVDDINSTIGRGEWLPIRLFLENDYERALAGLKMYDVLLVNPIQDGMNLVAKEGALVNEKAGVVVLSTQAGAYEELSGGVLAVDPRDVEGTASALHAALEMPESWKRVNSTALRIIVENGGVGRWFSSQWRDVEPILHARRTQFMPMSMTRAALALRT